MFTLVSEVHFWTQKSSTSIRDTDLGALKYHEKKGASDSLLLAGKRSYIEKRGLTWCPSNKRPAKLKECLKELEDQLSQNRVIYLHWRSSTLLQMVLSNGMVVNILLSSLTGDIQEILFDKFMIGKLLCEYISDVIIASSYALFAYSDNLVTLVHFVKPSMKNLAPKKWSNLDSKVQHMDLAGPSRRRVGRKMSISKNEDKILVWWKCGRDEVYPWSPAVRDEDRANVHVYELKGTKMELLYYYRTEFDPLIVTFSSCDSKRIHSIQQKVSRKGDVTVEWSILGIEGDRLEVMSLSSFQLPTHSCAITLSPKENKLLVACIDGSLLLTDSSNSIASVSKGAFIPGLLSWHPDSCIIVASNDRGQLQFFDLALNCIKTQLISEDVTPSSILDFGSYFKDQPALVKICWSKKSETCVQLDGFLLLLFERGPLAILRVFGGGGGSKGTHCSGLGGDVIISQYLNSGNVERALNVLLTLHWDNEGDVTLSSLQIIINHLLKLRLTPEREAFLEKALGSYHIAKKPLSRSAEVEFSDSVHDLSRRVFHHLLRYQVFDKAFRLGIDLGDYDLFMDIHNYCKRIGNAEMAMAALEKAEQLSDCSSSGSEVSSCECSESSCSCSSEYSYSSSENHTSSIVPPLPVVFNSLPPQPPPRHKVKFSNTVTHISVPDLDLNIVPEEISMNTLGLPTIEVPESFGNHTPSQSSLSDTQRSRLSHEEEEPGKIKVVHFGLV